MRYYLPISIVLLAFFGLATLYSAVVPLGEGPDEPGHAAYVFFIARTGRLPAQNSDGQPEVPGEGHQPPLAYALAAPAVLWLPPEERRFELPGNPNFTWAGGAEANAVAHGSREYPPWQGEVLAWHLARMVSVVLGAATVGFTYLAGLAIGKRVELDGNRLRNTALLAAALVAFNPQFLFTAGLITNDALLAALSAALLWLIVRGEGRTTSDRRLQFGRPLVLGLLLGLALLTKQSALILVPIALLAVLEDNNDRTIQPGDRADSGSEQGQQRRILYRRHPFALVRSLLLLGVAALVCGWWYVRNWRLYGDPLGLAAFRAEFTTQAFEIGNIFAWTAAVSQLHDSFWARFGWMNVFAPAWVIWLATVVELLGLAGLLIVAVHGVRRSNLTIRTSIRPAIVGHWSLIALPLLALVWLVSFALTAGLVAWQGRLLFPALPAFAILLARGLSIFGHWERPARVGQLARFTQRLILGLWLVAALWIPFGVIRPAYPFHTLPEDQARALIDTPIYARFGRNRGHGVELRGWSLAGQTNPGNSLDVSLLWHAQRRQERNWVVFVHLVDKNGEIVAEDNRPPRDGAFPMTQWVEDDWVQDLHPLHLPADLAPGEYELRVGLYEPHDNERRPVYSRDRELIGDYLAIGHIIVE